MIKGKVHSIQSLGTLDGPGIRFVVFTQGCPLRCGCCHNPDTWSFEGGKEYLPSQIVDTALRYREYFGKQGGVTFSGGEPLVQAEFVKETFRLCKIEKINTCLDTSGCYLNSGVKELLDYTDRVLLDVKYTDDDMYKKHVGCSFERVKEFLRYLDQRGIATTLRQVIIPTLNDTQENAVRLKELKEKHRCVDKIELLPFKKICIAKYQQMKLDFAFDVYPAPDKELMDKMNKYFD